MDTKFEPGSREEQIMLEELYKKQQIPVKIGNGNEDSDFEDSDDENLPKMNNYKLKKMERRLEYEAELTDEVKEKNQYIKHMLPMTEQLKHNRNIRPLKLSHIKNNQMLNNCFDPIVNKYVKKVWAFKRTKLNRVKRDLIWEFFRNRKKQSFTETLRKTYYKNIKNVTVIYFDDPVEHNFDLTRDMIDAYKTVLYERRKHNSINPLTDKSVKQLVTFKRFKSGRVKKYTFWDTMRHSEAISVRDALIKTYHNNIRNISIIYNEDPDTVVPYEVTEEIFNQLSKK